MKLLPLVLSSVVLAGAAEIRAVYPSGGAKAVGPYSPGLIAGGLLYVSGQGARDASGQLPQSVEAQIRQCLENVKGIVTAGGLSMEHVVSSNVYLTSIKNLDTFNAVWSQYFPKDPPTRTVIGVSRMPTDTPVEVAVVAVTDLKRKKIVQVGGQKTSEPVSAAIHVGDRVFLSAGGTQESSGSVPKDPQEQIKAIVANTETVLKAAGLEMRHLLYANIYVDPGMPLNLLANLIDDAIPDETARTIIQTNALPRGVHLQISGVASRESQRTGGHCSSVKETTYCSGRVGTVRQALDTLRSDVHVNKIELTRTVSANVYLDDIEEFAGMNALYAKYFGKVPPTRTTVQPWKKVAELSLPPATGVSVKDDDSPRGQISIIAVH